MKTTITADPDKLAKARALAGNQSASAVIDEALTQFIRGQELQYDIAAYAALPPTAEETAWAEIPRRLDLDDDDVDYEALYGTPQ